MKKIVWVYGTIAGLIMGAMFFITVPFWRNGMINFDNGMYVGYTTMVIALSLVFFGTKSYRDNEKNGVITFAGAFKVGILITLIASVLYALSWEVAYRTVSKGFSEKMTEYYLDEARSEAKTEAEAKEAEAKVQETFVMYENPIFRFAFSLMEVSPVGLIVTFLSSALLRRKEFLPPAQTPV
jgi:hypothetical protein